MQCSNYTVAPANSFAVSCLQTPCLAVFDNDLGHFGVQPHFAAQIFQARRAWLFAVGYAPLLAEHRDLMKATVIWNIEAGLDMSIADYADICRRHRELMARVHDFMRSEEGGFDITVTTHPAISVPGGFTPDGLPVGLQLVGRYHADRSVLELAHAWEQATGWGERLPPEIAATGR